MPELNLGQTVETEQSSLEVTVGPENPLPPGRHVFQLVVEDDSGNISQPDTVEVIVRDTQAPTAVLRAPQQVELGQAIVLDGSDSSDVAPGRVARYRWTKVE